MRPLTIPLCILCILLAVGFGGCSTMQVKSEYEPEASFGGLESYAWLERGEDEGRRGRRLAPVAVRQLVTSVDRELAAKGYRKVESDPDFLVNFVAATQDEVGERTVITDERIGYASGRSMVYVERQGALVLMISEPDSDRIIWRGWATDVVEDPDVEKLVKKVDEGVTKVLAQFPPER
ncbi:MAG: DUF4136 domain-containing protein [Gemmatimonadota bacterium]|nr:MAG: DUF4136 domain-containing protein [Gemmatimonadota bacterium]